MPYEMSIETTPGVSEKDGFHLGTDLKIARQICEERFHARRRFEMPTVSIAIVRDGKLVDCYDGEWSSER